MLPENIKLFFSLYFRPLAAMSDLIDHGHWLFGAAVTTAIAALLAWTVTTPIYQTYESVPVSSERLPPPPPPPPPSDNNGQSSVEEEEPRAMEIEEIEIERRPLPIIG